MLFEHFVSSRNHRRPTHKVTVEPGVKPLWARKIPEITTILENHEFSRFSLDLKIFTNFITISIFAIFENAQDFQGIWTQKNKYSCKNMNYQEFFLPKKSEAKNSRNSRKKHDTIPRILTSQEIGDKKNTFMIFFRHISLHQ